ncbi:UNVERIFIED_CONTAM: 30S ribosomal protein S6 [Campylobacter lari]
MNKYEIMLILDPAAEALNATQIVESAFGKSAVKKAEKLELSNLAYPINKSLKAQYMVYSVEAEANKVAEFTRKSNITKYI